MLILTLLSVAEAATYTVDPAGGGDATTIAEGVALLSEGDTLSIAAGTYQAYDVRIYVDGVTIEGAGWESTTFDGSLGSETERLSGFWIASENVTVRGIGFRNYLYGSAYNYAVGVDGGVSIADCAFIGNVGGVLLYAGVESGSPSRTTIVNTLFADNTYAAIYAPEQIDTLHVESSVFINNERGVYYQGRDNGLFNEISIVDNTFVGTSEMGAISIGSNTYGTSNDYAYQTSIVNNLFAGGLVRWGLSLGDYFYASTEVLNNVYAPTTTARVDEGAEIIVETFDYTESDNLEAEPTFVAWTDDGDWTNDDLRLVAGSAGIDAGAEGYTRYSTDMDGQDRTVDGDGDWRAEPDAGAYELCLSGDCAPEEGDADTSESTLRARLVCASLGGAGGGAGLTLALLGLLARRRPLSAPRPPPPPPRADG